VTTGTAKRETAGARRRVGDPVLEARDLYRFYHAGDEEILALRGVSLNVDAGEQVAVVGPSGSGKSTLLGCLAGLDDPDGGVVRICGERITRVDERRRALTRARHVGVLLQSANLIEHLTIAGNVTLAQRLVGSQDRAAVASLLGRLGIATHADAYPPTLSGGEAARAGLAVALANNPSVLLADEPTGELDQHTAMEVASLLSEEAARGVAVVVVTHADELASRANRVVELRDGRVQS
jgi:putative ABC transport system ATP-binding protein